MWKLIWRIFDFRSHAHQGQVPRGLQWSSTFGVGKGVPLQSIHYDTSQSGIGQFCRPFRKTGEISSLKVSSAALVLHESSEWSANASTWVTRTLLDVVPLENFSLKTHLFCSLQMLYLYFFSATQMQYCCHHKLNTSFSTSTIWIFAPKIKLKTLRFLYFGFKNSNVSLIILEIMGKND